MALLFAGRTVTVYVPTETPDPVTKVVPVPTLGEGQPLAVHIEPVRSEVLVDSRTGAELLNPYRMFVEPEDIGVPVYGALVVDNDTEEQFRVTKKALRNKAGDAFEDLEHGVCEMELLEIGEEVA